MNNVRFAAQIIINGGLVAFPTETVFGLGADATNDQACKKIFALKNRPFINPLIVHVDSKASAEEFAIINTEQAKKLIEAFWPGPLTIVVPLKKNSKIASSVLGKNNTVAIRMPAHDLALDLIKQAKCPIAAPSANPSGYISSTSSNHVLKHFSKKDVFILNSSDCKYGLESTIVDLTSLEITVLRHGFITTESIEAVLEQQIKIDAGDNEVIRSPGMLSKHYAPYSKIRLNADSLYNNEIGLDFGNNELLGPHSLNLSKKGDLIEAAANLYKMLRKLDEEAMLNNHVIAIANVPFFGIGRAINDRLKRAASSE
ncbi:MAG: threonylcarbamoyl-AMP synthase [Rickettsiaceae bacterium]|nr:MAG: threonylcarbamoyl-AMP synthase [Rickettsiaceae bacterium]